MLFTCLVPRLRGHSDLLYCDFFPPSTFKSAESVLLPLLFSSGGRHPVSALLCPREDLVNLLCLLPPSASFSVSESGPAALEVKTGSRSPGFWESLNQPILRGACPRVFALCKFSLRLQPKALLAEPSSTNLAKDPSLSPPACAVASLAFESV